MTLSHREGNSQWAILKSIFTSESGRIRHEVDASAADCAARGGLRAWFVAVSLVAHAALFFALRAPASSHPMQRAHEDLVMFEMPALAPPPAAPMPIAAPPPEVVPPAAARPARVPAPLEAVAANPPPAPADAPAAQPAEPAAQPTEPAAPASAGALPTDAHGSLAMATGAGGAGGPLGASGAGTGSGTSLSARGAVGTGGTGVDRRALALAWKAAVERLLRERASLNYPRSARRAHLGGTVLLSITVDARGHITLVRVDRTSGVEALDEAAVATVADIGAVPPPPPELDWHTRSLRMPIEYAVR